jgi:lipopolysaccharide/colanic/teichoic acid biosynthesis glycosyltransferase
MNELFGEMRQRGAQHGGGNDFIGLLWARALGERLMNRQVHDGVGERVEPVSRRIPLWKRSLDLVVILLVSPGLLLIGAVVALIIKLGSPGPVFFRQKRIGYQGREFTIFKFRTMRTDAKDESHRQHTAELIRSNNPMVKLDARKDPRLIPLGSALRATGLDELPQIMNVLIGDMSLVGPRPCMPYEYALYEPWHRRRFEAVPGLTGLWQVSGKNRTTFDEMVRLDIEYAERQSLGLDLAIMLKTLPALCGQCNDLLAARLKRAGPAPKLSKSIQSTSL